MASGPHLSTYGRASGCGFEDGKHCCMRRRLESPAAATCQGGSQRALAAGLKPCTVASMDAGCAVGLSVGRVRGGVLVAICWLELTASTAVCQLSLLALGCANFVWSWCVSAKSASTLPPAGLRGAGWMRPCPTAHLAARGRPTCCVAVLGTSLSVPGACTGLEPFL